MTSLPAVPRGAEGDAPPPHASRPWLRVAGIPAWFAFATLGLAALAALALPGHPAGLGLALVGAGMCALVAAAAPQARGSAPAVAAPTGEGDAAAATGRDAFATGCWVAAAVLAAVPAVRAAAWVVALSLLAAFALAAVAAAGARTWRELAAALAGAVGGLLPGPLVVVATAVQDAGARRWRWFGPVARGALLAAVLLAVFVPLLVAADAAFAELTDGLWSLDADIDRPVARAGAALLALAIGGGLLLAALRRRHRPDRPATGRLGRAECAIALGALDVTFAAFVSVQLTTLFGGHEHVLATAGLTYAEYARSGVFQLAAVAALALAVLAGAVRWGPADARLSRVLLGVLCALTLVMVASALRRLGLYEDAFGATRLRVLVHVALLWLGTVFALVLLAGLLRRGALVPRALVGLSALAALGFAAVNPDARIASRNVDRYRATGDLDVAYLRTLSADAAPAIARLPPMVAACASYTVRWDLRREDGLAGANLGRARARDALDGLPGPRC